MGGLSIWHWLIVLLVVLIFFGGRGRLADMMGDAGKGIKAFKKGLGDDEGKDTPAVTRAPEPPTSVTVEPAKPYDPTRA